ncbi:Ig-like domain-containing protein [Bifidobacterium criceti]|uniref:Ig-like domain-containing protein n=1 Tax=Bifidobacterium criceti TaxID=1960969 RepID=UPI0013906D30|nr:Ig-like domain-containing protein [Bifidobacterium criceti]
MAGLAAAATLFGGMVVGVSSAEAADTTSYDRTLGNPTFEAAREANGLAKEMNYGSILHAWMWSFNTIKNNMADIADAGYTSIQTSPISNIVGPRGSHFDENWWYVYQPAGTSIGNAVVGSEADLKAMTAEAHKYGIRVIVDGVINHFTADWNGIESSWKNSDLFHSKSQGGCADNGTKIDYWNRWQVTHCHLLGLWDLNTENQEVANRMQAYLKKAVADGVDGFRYDAAKHIELPNEFQTHSPYFDTILQNGAQYQYGEVLQGENTPAAEYPKLFIKYSTNGGGNTASDYGKTLRQALWDKNLNAGTLGDWRSQGMAQNQLVTWVESHDTYANKDKEIWRNGQKIKTGESADMTAWQMRMGWGVVGARAGGAPLFFNRPVGSGGDGAQFAEQSHLGDAGDNEWKHPEVANVNKFRNAMEGNAEYLRNCQGNNCLMIERYKSDGNSNNDGVTVVNMDGDKNLAGMDTVLDDGEYVDQVYGGKLTVSGKKITSGSVKSGKVHVFFNASNTPRASLSVTGSKTFKTATTTVTLNARNVNNARYSTSEGASGSFTDGQTITIGANSPVNTQITVTLTGTDQDGNAVRAQETFTKKDPNAVVSYTAYAKKPAAWNKIYAYVYVDNNAAAGSVIENAAWPGELMTAESGACDGTADQVYEIPEDIIDQAGDDPIRVIFNNGGAGEIAGNKFPGDSAVTDPDDHVDAAGLLIDGSYVWDGNITSGTWEEASCLAVTVDSVTISPAGTINLDLATGATAQLTATVAPAAAAGKPVKWTSSNERVAAVKNGVVQGLSKGTATITASVGGKSDTVTVNVTGEAPVVHDTTVYYPASKFGANSTYLHYRVNKGGAAGTWTTAPGVKMEAACDGYVKYTIEGTEGDEVEFVFNNGSGQWDNNGEKNYKASGANIVVENGTIGSVAPCVTVVPVQSVSIAGGDVELKEGASKQLSATVSPSNATNRSVSWKSSNTSVATVDASGKVTAVAAGSATVTATAGGKSASVTVTVKGEDPVVPVQSVSISGTGVSSGKATINVGAGLNLTATVLPSNATDQNVTWISSDDSVAAVSSTGAVRGVKAGMAVIMATAGGKSSSVIVTVQEAGPVLQSIAIAGTGVANNKLSLVQNKSVQLSVKATPSNATIGAVSWDSSDTSVATVDGNGKVTAKQEGMAVITATVGDKHSSVVLTVTKSGQSSDRFSDVPAGILFHDEIEWLAAQGVTMGNSDGTYGYADSLNRRDMAIFLYRLAKVHGVGDAASYVPSDADYARFSDVRKGDFGAVEVLWMASHGIANGTDGRYEGLKTLNRRDMAIFLTRYARLAGVEGAGSYRPSAAEYGRFSDVSEGMFGAEEILWMAKAGITNGNADGSFGAYQDMQRHAMAAFLYRLDKLV